MIETTKVPNRKILDLEEERKWLIESSKKVIRTIDLCMDDLIYVDLLGSKIGSTRDVNFPESRLESLGVVKSLIYNINQTLVQKSMNTSHIKVNQKLKKK